MHIIYTFHLSDENDFKPLRNIRLTFPKTALVGFTLNQSVTVIGDAIMEGTESFTVAVTPENSNDVISGPSSATITIPNDNDSMFLINDTYQK